MNLITELHMKRILHILLLLLSFTFVSCNDDKDEEIAKIDTFDYNVLNERLNENCLKIYDKDSSLLVLKKLYMAASYDDMLYLGAYSDRDRLFNMYWHGENFRDIKNKKDTFPVFAGYNKQHSKKGIVVIKSLEYKDSKSYNPPALYDSIFMEVAFNLQFDSDNMEKMIKGVFYYKGKLEGTLE